MSDSPPPADSQDAYIEQLLEDFDPSIGATAPAAVPAPAATPAPSRWYLGFDCATKTFAFSLSRVDLGAFRAAKARLRKQMGAAQEILRRAGTLARTDPASAAEIVQCVSASVAAADAETRGFIRLADGETIDLFPGIPDEEIPTVERLRAVARYVAGRVRPAVQRHVPAEERLRVVVEFQMGPNSKTRAVAAALIALFAEDDVFIVGPSLKNKIFTCERGRYCYFAERYRTSYTANKAHAKYNFARIEEVFGTQIPVTRPPSLRGHIADSFMQVLGHLVHGDDENAAAYF